MTNFNRYIESYVHDGRIGVLLEFGVSDFTKRTDAFGTLAKDLAMHIAASAPDSVASLLLQPFIRDTALTVEQRISETARKLREEITVRRFVRWDTDPYQPTQDDPPRPPAMIHHLRGAG